MGPPRRSPHAVARRGDWVAQLRATRLRRAPGPGRPLQLLDGGLHQLAAGGAVRACLVAGLPETSHTPEFSFEHEIDRVRQATKSGPIDYPAALDNDYEIWSAFDKAESPRPRSSFLRRLRRTPKANRRLNARLCGRSRVSPSLRSRSRDLLRSSAVGSCTSSCGQETGSYLVTYQEADLFSLTCAREYHKPGVLAC
jgi:hypothetical protein